MNTAPSLTPARRTPERRAPGDVSAWRSVALLAPLITSLGLWYGSAQAAPPDAASQLRAKHAELADVLASNAFGRPVHMESTESGDAVSGEIHAVLEHPFSQAGKALRQPANWCEVMILPINTKYCRAEGNGDRAALQLAIGKKNEQEITDTQQLNFSFQVNAARADFLQVQLDAQRGPVGTRDYRVALEAVPLGANRTFMRLRYSYAYGFTGKLAMQAYLATAGASKVGFSTLQDAEGRQRLVGGMRGVIERNTMRYYLAIDAYLDSLDQPAQAQLDHRLRAWFAATERYPKQLREVDEASYLSMKRSEYKRQQAQVG